VVGGRAKTIKYLMDKDKMNYFELAYPFLIGNEFPEEIFTEAIETHNYVYWLKLHYFVGRIDERRGIPYVRN